MKHRSTWLAALICVNLVLLTAVLVVGRPPQPAQAQTADLGRNYLLLAGEIQDEFDGLYVLDVRERALHTFYVVRGSNQLKYGGFRDLQADFQRGP
ncbi:MAG: hypothetical protein AB1716_14580 [Planctomycetota bacterium]